MADEWVEVTDADGTWLVRGNARQLITPSQAWLDTLPAPYVPPPDPELEEIRAIIRKQDQQISPAEQVKALLLTVRRLERTGRL